MDLNLLRCLPTILQNIFHFNIFLLASHQWQSHLIELMKKNEFLILDLCHANSIATDLSEQNVATEMNTMSMFSKL